MENRNAQIIARNLRERFSTGFLTPVISTALCAVSRRPLLVETAEELPFGFLHPPSSCVVRFRSRDRI